MACLTCNKKKKVTTIDGFLYELSILHINEITNATKCLENLSVSKINFKERELYDYLVNSMNTLIEGRFLQIQFNKEINSILGGTNYTNFIVSGHDVYVEEE